MESDVIVAVATALFAALLYALLRPNKAEANLGDMTKLKVTGWDNLRPRGTAIFADMLARAEDGNTYRFESFVVDEPWMKRLVGASISGEVVGEQIVRFRPTWDSNSLFVALDEQMGFTSRNNDYAWALYNEKHIGIASDGDWISIDIELEWTEGGPDYLIEIEWLGDGPHVPLYAEELHQGHHIVRLVDEARPVYDEVIEPRLSQFLELVDASSTQLVITPHTVTYSIDAAPCLAAANLAVHRAFAAVELFTGEGASTEEFVEW